MNLLYLMADGIDVKSVESICSDANLGHVFSLIGTAVQIILIVIPVLLVIFGLIDLAKAVMAGEDKEIKAAQKLLLRRVIYTVVAFLFIFLVKASLNILVPNDGNRRSEVVECLDKMFS